MPRFKLTIEYDGTDFSGWQRQGNGPSIQQSLEEALARLGQPAPLVAGAGRTDAGVHALGQVAHIDLDRDWVGWRLKEAINGQLAPAPIAVLDAEAVDDAFDARRSAIMRWYRYAIVNRRAPLTFERDRAWRVKRELDVAAMAEAAKALIGRHDFTTFRDVQCQAHSPVRTLSSARHCPRRRAYRLLGLGAVVPASPGALDGRLARRGRPRPLDARRSQGGAGGRRPQPLRPRRAGLRALFDAGGLRGGETSLERSAFSWNRLAPHAPHREERRASGASRTTRGALHGLAPRPSSFDSPASRAAQDEGRVDPTAMRSSALAGPASLAGAGRETWACAVGEFLRLWVVDAMARLGAFAPCGGAQRLLQQREELAPFHFRQRGE